MSQPCLPVSNVGPTKILPFLFLGSQQDALSQETMQVCLKHGAGGGWTYSAFETTTSTTFILTAGFQDYLSKPVP